MVTRKKRNSTKGDRLSMRLNSTDKKRIREIKRRTGVTSKSEAVRIALKNSVRR